MKKPKPANMLHVFLDEYVDLIGAFNLGKGMQPASIQGYLLEIDDTHYYLGDESGEIDMAIKIDTIISICIVKPNTKNEPSSRFMQVLEDMPMPVKDEDVN